MKLLPIKALTPSLNLITESSSFFRYAKERYPKYVTSGFYTENDKPAIFIYEINDSFTIRRGIVASTHVSDIANGHIIPHEKTLAAKEQHMIHLMLQRQAQIKPTLFAYQDDDKINDFIHKTCEKEDTFLDIFLEESAEVHRFWKLSKSKEIEWVVNSFKAINKVYVADGHHRCSTMARLYGEKDIQIGEGHDSSILSAYFSWSQLKIYDFNRVISLEDFMSSTEFVVRLSKYANLKPIKSAAKPSKKYRLNFYIDHQWYQMQWKKKTLNLFIQENTTIDYQVFNEIIIKKILGIEDVRSANCIEYVEGISGIDSIENKVDSGISSVGFCLYPVTKQELIALADQGIPLPPKSTAFVPRIKNGMIVQKL